MGSSVGSRALKTRLGAWLRRVRRGETVVITDRGDPVAEIRPLSAGRGHEDAALAGLEALGVVTRPLKPALPRFRPIRSAGRPASLAVIDGREDRF